MNFRPSSLIVIILTFAVPSTPLFGTPSTHIFLSEHEGVTQAASLAQSMQSFEQMQSALGWICIALALSLGYTIYKLYAANTRLEARVREQTSDLSRKNKELMEEIEEQRRAKRHLAENEHRLRSIFESEPECVKLVAADGTLLDMNPAGLRLLDASNLDEIAGRSIYQVITPEYHDTFRKLNAAVFQGQSGIAEYEVINLKGTHRWMETHACPLRNAEGTIVAHLAVTHDVTARRKAEAELAYERDLLRTLLENSPDQIYFKDCESRFLKCSNALVIRFQASCERDLVGKTDFDFFAEAHARPAFEDEQEIIRTGVPVVGKIEKEFWKDQKDRITWVLSTKVPLKDKTGAIIGTFGISKDITAIKEAEKQLEAVHTQLLESSRKAGMAEVATSVLHNVGNVLNSVNVSFSVISQKIRKTRIESVTKVAALLEERSGNLGDFFTNDPAGQKLPAFVGKLAVRLKEEQAEVLDELQVLGKNIEHIKEIIAVQQSYAHVSGVCETLAISELLEDALRMNAGAASRHGIEIIREYEEVPEIPVEKHKVLQILVNLLHNAKHALADGGRPDKQLRIGIKRQNGHIAVTVRDNGIGIAPENMTRIFAHGFTTKKNGHGFGLHSGVLAAKEMGGSLTVHSDGPGTGATFTLELPIDQHASL